MSSHRDRSAARFALAALLASFPAVGAPSEVPAGPLRLQTLRARVVSHHPALTETRSRERALSEDAHAEGSLPSPEVMVEVWQIPLSKPPASHGASTDNRMVMIGVRQDVPAPGSLGAAERAAQAEASVQVAERAVVERMLIRESERAFADYEEAWSRLSVRREFLGLASDVVTSARLRYSAGGALADVASAELSRSRARAELDADAFQVRAAAARINGLLGVSAETPVGPPEERGSETTSVTLAEATKRADVGSPEVLQARAMQLSSLRRAEAVQAKTRTPSFSFGATYFHPFGDMPLAWGASASMSLPWLWGEAGHREGAERARVEVATAQAEGARRRARMAIAEAWWAAKSAEVRLASLASEVEPSARRAVSAAGAGALSPTGPSVSSLLGVEEASFEVRLDVVRARADLARALADLDAVAGEFFPRVPLPTTEAVASGDDK